jgi:predicted CoA-binding protein
MATQSEIEAFLDGARLVAIGISVIGNDYTRNAVRTLSERGHDIVPIRPGIADLDGRRVYPTVAHVPGDIDGALLFTPPALTERMVYECAERGIYRFWLDPGGIRGKSADAIELCLSRGYEVLVGGSIPQEPWIRRMRRETPRWAALAFRRA